MLPIDFLKLSEEEKAFITACVEMKVASEKEYLKKVRKNKK